MLRDATAKSIGALHVPRLSPRIGYRLLVAALTALGGAAIAVTVPQPSGPLGRMCVVSFVIVAPLVAITRLLPGVNAALALIVGAAGAVVINTLVVQTMLAAGAWSHRAGVVAVGIAAALLWLAPTSHSTTKAGAA